MNYKVLSNKVLAFANWNSRVPTFKVGSMGLTSKLKNVFNKFSGKKTGRYLVITLVAVIVIFGAARIVKSFGGNKKDNRVAVKGAKATEEVNKEFQFPLRNDNGDEVGKLKYVIEKAEKRDEIIVQGQTATAVKGRTFLIVNLRLSNDLDQSVKINTRDYMRLSINGDESTWLAPDIHNDPVEVQAISTKSTRLGFPINDSDQNLKLRIGEIDGEKKTIGLTL